MQSTSERHVKVELLSSPVYCKAGVSAVCKLEEMLPNLLYGMHMKGHFCNVMGDAPCCLLSHSQVNATGYTNNDLSGQGYCHHLKQEQIQLDEHVFGFS